MIKKENNFCIRPFNSALIKTNGNIRVCCRIKDTDIVDFNINRNNIKEWWNSDYIKNLRKKFLNNEKPNECITCWNEEDAGIVSHRIRSNHEYKIFFTNNHQKYLKLLKKENLQFPEDIEINLTNLCNLKCQMCSGVDSSKLLVENNKLGFEKLKQKEYEFNIKNFKKIKEILNHDISLINLRGGEPFLDKKILNLIELLIKNKKSNNIKLHITTNGTICNEKIINLLKNFKDITIMFSLESTGSYNDYIRYPSSWNNIKENILNFQKLKNVYPYINTVVQNLNILYLEELITFAYDNKIFIKFSKLAGPKYLEYTNLPLDLLKNAHNKLINIDKKKIIHVDSLKEIILDLEKNIKNYKFDKIKFNMFTDMIKKRDQYRKISIADYMPEIYNII